MRILRKTLTTLYFFVSFVCLLGLAGLAFINGLPGGAGRNLSSIQNTGSGPIENFVTEDVLRIKSFVPNQFFLLSNTNHYSLIEITNDLQKTLELKVSCDEPYSHAPLILSPHIAKRKFAKAESNNEYYHLHPKESLKLLLSSNIKRCQLAYKNLHQAEQWGSFNLYTETLKFKWLKGMLDYKDICAEGGRRFEQLTCPHEAKPTAVEILDTPESGFIAKAEMLLGQKLPESFIQNQNPFAEIDFSKAPKLNAIYLATLVYRSDFYGNVIARLLKYHADKGTLVHVVTTAYMMLDKDKTLLRGLAQNGNFRLQEFKYNDPHYDVARPARFIDSKFRDMHIKLLITLSEEEAFNSVVAGGRNIHDGFLFKSKPDYTKLPELVQYGEEEDFVHWNDFEVKVTSQKMALLTANHLLKFINRDTSTQQMDPFSYPDFSENSEESKADSLKHMISLPYTDGHALEELYVNLIKGAKKSIKISSPYLRPTKKIMAALLYAAERGVDIQIQTRVSLKGDTQAWLYEEVNKESINALFDKIKIYQWKEDSILHSKFLLIDGKISFVGSINLSRRSFIQDVENGYIVQSERFAEVMESVFNSYLKKSSLITQKEKRKLLPSILIELLKNQF